MIHNVIIAKTMKCNPNGEVFHVIHSKNIKSDVEITSPSLSSKRFKLLHVYCFSSKLFE